MKKNSFMEGAVIATVAIIFTKILGLIYVIPFFSIIGVKGSILYGYAYSIYAIFLSLSIGGIPIAISKIISEYNALGYYYTKEKAYKIGSIIIMSIGFISFFLLILFAPNIAQMIIGDLKGGNTIEEVSKVIRIVSTALLIVPLLSVTKGYLQGHKFISPTSIANVLEQIVRVVVILIGSYTLIKVLNMPIESGVEIAVFGATIGAFVSYFYLFFKMKKNKDKLIKNSKITREEARITTFALTKKIVFYALPFILIELLKSAYGMVDTFTIVRTMDGMGYSDIAELTVGVVTSLAPKLSMIIISVSVGINVSLIPNIASSYIKKNFSDISSKINNTICAILFIGLPMTIGFYFLAQPIWVVFYDYNLISIDIFRVFIFQALTFSIFAILVNVFQTMNNFKMAIGTLVAAFLLKLFLNAPSMMLFDRLNIAPYHGPNVLTLIIQVIAIVFMLFVLKKKYQYKYKDYLSRFIRIVMTSLIMLLVLLIFEMFIPIHAQTKIGAIIEIIIFGLLGSLTYVFVVFKTHLIYDIFGETFVKNILKKLKIIK